MNKVEFISLTKKNYKNKNLLKEDGFGAEITINVFDFYIPFSFCVFTNYYKNKIQWSGNTVKNVASAFYLGANLSFEKSFFNFRCFNFRLCWCGIFLG